MSRRGKPASARTPVLSVCLIVRNEEAHLARCLEPVRALADELIVVDTGSTDRTLEIAESFGARTFHLTWQDDFSLARNYCISQATGAERSTLPQTVLTWALSPEKVRPCNAPPHTPHEGAVVTGS